VHFRGEATMGPTETTTVVRKVLIADDDPTTRSLLGECFSQSGFKVLVAADGVEACSVAIAEKPDVALIDLLLPRRDGYSVLLHLRSRETTRRTPVLILSGESADVQEPIARALGAQAFVSKPVSHSSVLDSVMEILERKT
jgi:DNA-binding response OmpR family regulator